jgi:probable phosphoglycerate mutase
VTRRRLYLMRHAEVAYVAEDRPVTRPDEVGLTASGEEQARTAAAALADVQFDRVLASGLRRTLETARLVVPDREPEIWHDLREISGGRVSEIPEDELEEAFLGAFRGDVPLETRFLGGESVGELLDRVVPAVERLVADEGWDTVLAVLHGGVNRAILSYALTGERRFLGHLEQAPACINILDCGDGWIVRAVNHTPYDPLHSGGRSTTMEELWTQYLRWRQRLLDR